jgi:hypothetical protein
MRKFSTVLSLDLRLAFAFSFAVLRGNSINSQGLVSVFHNYHNSRGGFSAGGFFAVVSYPAIPRTRKAKGKSRFENRLFSNIGCCCGLGALAAKFATQGHQPDAQKCKAGRFWR